MPEDSTTKYIAGPELPEPSLFDSTSIAAGRAASRIRGERYRGILQHLSEKGPACIFEIAAALATPEHPVFDHQISGRFGELVKSNCIRRTGERRIKPTTGCHAEVYTLTTIGLAILNEPSKPLLRQGER